MPIEIKELVIRAVVTDPSIEGGREAATASEATDREALIEECVRQVLKVLRRTEER